MRAAVVRPIVISAVSLGLLAACGSDSSTTATTMKPLTSTNFATVPPVDETTTTSAANPVPEEQMYTIQAGDFLAKIAQQFGVSIEDIVGYNGWEDGINHVLIPGQEIKIPGGGTPPTDQAGGTTTVPVTGGQTTTTQATGTESGATYTVEAGDYLAGIAQKFDTTVDAIVAANGWASSEQLIYPGMEIKLPA